MTPTNTLRAIQGYLILTGLVMLACVSELEWKNLYFFQFVMNMLLVMYLETFMEEEGLPKTTQEMWEGIEETQGALYKAGVTVEELVLSMEVLGTVARDMQISTSLVMEGYCIDPIIDTTTVLENEYFIRTEQ